MHYIGKVHLELTDNPSQNAYTQRIAEENFGDQDLDDSI